MNRYRVVDEYRKQEYQEKRGRGIIKLISDLQWIRNAELDNEKPYEEKRILPRKRVFFWLAGAGLAASLHYGLSIVFFLFSVIFGLLSPTAGEVYAVLAMFLKTGLYAALPIWLIDQYHVWDRGITRLVLSDVIFWGYVPTLVFLIVLSGMGNLLLVALLNGLLAVKKPLVVWMYQHLKFLFSWWTLAEYPVQILFTIAIPFLYMRKKDRENHFTVKPYTLLDEIPED